MCAGVRCEPNFFGFTTLELMELENIVANTVYLKAREGMLYILTLDVSLISVVLECKHTNYYVVPHVLSEFWHFLIFLYVACCCLWNYLFRSMFKHRLCIHVIFRACLTLFFWRCFSFCSEFQWAYACALSCLLAWLSTTCQTYNFVFSGPLCTR